ncbi:MAG: tetratricopeptide repeat protein [Bacteroidia bacterium]|nr:tetratricopeptide repeat protein [Bacteroidia bacterium]MDW8417158.1 tetratricopeptide repeat protein [Bacteroidia bacterium]
MKARIWDIPLIAQVVDKGGLKYILFLGIGVFYAQGSPRENTYKLAQFYTQRQKWDSALIYWRGLLISERDSSSQALIYQQLGYIAVYRGDSAEALRLWRQSLLWKPDYRVAIQNYQWLYKKLRRPPATSPPPLSPYDYPTLSERAPPHLGDKPSTKAQKVRWLPVARLHN